MFTHSLIFVLVTQAASINGVVRDAKTHQRIASAIVQVEHAQAPFDRQDTDNDGRFQFPHLAPGRYTIVVNSMGYETSFVEVDLAPMMGLPVVVELVRTKTAPIELPVVVPLRAYMTPKGARKEFDRARDYARRQDCSKAIPHFHSGLRIFDQDAAAYNDLGNCYRRLGQLDDAETAFKHAKELSDSIYVCLNLAEVYTAQNRFKEAETLLLETIHQKPRAGDAYYGLALVYVQLGLWEAAQTRALEAEQHPHQVADVHLVLAEIYSRGGKHADAARQLQVYLKEAPNGQHSDAVRRALKASARSKPE